MKRLVATAFAAAAFLATTAARSADIVLVQPGGDGAMMPALDMNSAAFIEGSRLIVAAGPGPIAGVFSAASGERVVNLSGVHTTRIYAVTYIRPYAQLATAATEGRVIFWDRLTGEGLRQVTFDRDIGWPTAIAVASDGSILVVAGFDGIQVFTDRDNSRLLDVSAIGTILSAELTEAGRHIVVVGSKPSGPEPGAPYAQTLHVYDVANDTWTSGPSSRQLEARVMADGSIIVATADGRIASVPAGSLKGAVELRAASPENVGDSFAISRDGTRVLGMPLAFNRNGPTVFRLWDAATGTTVDVSGTLPGPVMGADLSDTGDRLLLTLHDNATRTTRTEIWTIDEHL